MADKVVNIQTGQQKLTQNKWFWIIGGILLLIIVVGIYFYKQGKKQTTQAKLPPNDNAGSNVPDSTLSSIAGGIYEDMSGVNWLTNHNEDAYTPALALSNYDFTRMYNIFNKQYQQKSGNTLTQWVSSQTAIPFTPWESTKKQMIAKLGANNLP